MKRIAMFVMACLLCVGMVTVNPLEASAATYYTSDSAVQDSCSVMGHAWVTAVDLNGVAGSLCTRCQIFEEPNVKWSPLTECQNVNRSNEKAHFGDVVVGKWNSRAGKLPNAIRFCVSNKKTYKNTHYTTYRLRGQYDTLSGLISFSNKSEKFATARIQIYFDNELEYESDLISATTDDAAFLLDVSGVEMVRIVCSTPDVPAAYCVVSAAVY